MKKNIKVTLNGKTVYGYKGQRILDLCAECGIEVPTLCYDPHLSLHGGCSVCLVEVEGARTLLRACANTITPGMVIKTDTQRAISARRTALELLLSDHVGDCRPPCTLACPGQGNVQGYVNLAAQGKYGESLDALHHHVTLPSCIGRVCPAPCEEVCRRRFVDDAPVSIREIKRFVGDWGIDNGRMGFVPEIKENGKRVAIVGGGPAGVSAAYYLRLKGYRPVIFEKEKLLGGMMRYGIPDYRLPQKILQTEIDWLLSHGIEVRAGTALGRDVTLDELRRDFDGVILAMGCWRSSPMRVSGEELDGVVGGIDFLYKVKTDPEVKVGARVVVVGGGNTAMDAARSAKRLGAEKVSVLYRRSREEMPAEEIEIVEADEEGVEFIFLAAPKTIEGSGRVERILCEKMELGEPDASGRRSPVPTGETFVLEADMVIAAIGQGIDFTGLPSDIHDGRRMKVGKDYDTALPGVFVCGDQQTGPKIAIEAIGNGHWAADSLDHYLAHGKPKKPFFYDIVREDLGPEDFAHIVRSVQEEVPHVPGETRLKMKFDEYSVGLSEEQTLRDANRCMECGCPDVFECKLREYAITHEVHPEKLAGEHIEKIEDANPYYARNLDKCILCAKCVRACDEVAGFHAIDFAKRGFESVLTPQFYRDMEDSDCTFCGLCTQVCPVGALIENRVDRWPHLEEPEIVKTTCLLCPAGCELELNLDRGRSQVARVTTDLDDPEAPTGGSCCVKGRYGFK
ncbi:MAG: FAD-dependent oxidoreductase, partial [Synergistota bacterium]|nr:FAD-dependent oxidoreductase [Synergistota bacterium]